MSTPSQHASGNALNTKTRRWYLAFAVGFIAFAIYGSLVPFEVQRVSLSTAADQFRVAMASWPRRIARSDVLANVLLFVPIGFALTGALCADRLTARNGVGAVLVVTPLATVASLLCEFLQMFARGRIPSPVDVSAQAVGTAIGFLMFVALGEAATDWVRQSRRAEGDDRTVRVLTLFTLGWLFLNLAPFDLTVDAGDIADRLQAGRIGLSFLDAPDTTVDRLLWDVLAEVLSAIPLGVFALLMTARRFGSSLVHPIVLGASLVFGVEAAQIFIRSHSAYLTDAIFGTLGVALGAWTGRRLVPSAATRSLAPPAAFAGALTAVIAIVLLVAYNWRPFDFTTDTELVRRKLARFSMVPFAAYSAGSYLNALKNVLVDFALAVPFGVALAVLFNNTRLPRRLTSAVAILAAVSVYGVIELGQFLLPTRTPDVTDILIGSVAVYAVMELARWAHAGLSVGDGRDSGTLEGVERREQQSRARGDVRPALVQHKEQSHRLPPADQ